MAINVFKLIRPINKRSALRTVIVLLVVFYLVTTMISRYQMESADKSVDGISPIIPRPVASDGSSHIKSVVSFDMWLQFYEGYKGLSDDQTAFGPLMTANDRWTFHELLSVYVTAMEKAQIPYYICDGSLLGSWRHHGMIPWDDDIDVCMDSRDQDVIAEALGKLAPDYVVVRNDSSLWKFFSRRNSFPVNGWTWNYPFIDLCFSVSEPRVATVKRPFWDLQVDAPRDMDTFLKKYKTEECETVDYSHRLEMKLTSFTTVACSDLWYAYPFVFRRAVARIPAVVETLVVNNRTIVSFEIAIRK